MKALAFSVAGQPVPQGSMTALLRAGTQQPIVVARNRIGLTRWRGDITAAAIRAMADQGLPRFEGAVGCRLIFTFVRPESHWLPVNRNRATPVLKPSAPRDHIQTPDIDKLARAALDSLTNANVWPDDKVVAKLVAFKFWAVYGEQPGLHIEVGELP